MRRQAERSDCSCAHHDTPRVFKHCLPNSQPPQQHWTPTPSTKSRSSSPASCRHTATHARQRATVSSRAHLADGPDCNCLHCSNSLLHQPTTAAAAAVITCRQVGPAAPSSAAPRLRVLRQWYLGAALSAAQSRGRPQTNLDDAALVSVSCCSCGKQRIRMGAASVPAS